MISGDKAIDERRPSSYRWVVISSFWGMSEAAQLVSLSLGVMLPAMTRDLNMSPTQSGVLGAIFWIITAILVIPLTALFSRYSPKKIVTVTMFVGGVFTLLQGWAPTYEIELLGRAGFVAAFISRTAVFPLLIQQWFETREVPAVQGITSGLGNLASSAAVALTPFWMELVGGWRGALYTYGVLLMMTCLIWHLVGRERVTRSYLEGVRTQGDSPLRSVVKYKELWLAGFGFMGMMGGWSSFIVFWPTFLLREKDIPLTTAGLLIGLFPLGSMAGSFLSTFVMDKVGYKKPVICVATVAAFAMRLSMLWGDSTIVLGASSFVHGVLVALIIPALLAIPYDLAGVKPREVAVGAAFIVTLMNAGAVFGPPLVGFIYENAGTLFVALLVSTFYPLAMLIPGLFLPETGRRARRKKQPAFTPRQ